MITFVDLVYNYDLLVHSTTYLYLQRVNPPKELILCTFTNIQNMIHSLRRVFWDYQSTYGGDTQDVTITPHPPPQGIDQGNGYAPVTWSIFSTSILNQPRESRHGASFKCYISGDIFRMVEYCFVDNSTIV